MGYNKRKNYLLAFFFSVWGLVSFAQITAGKLQNFIASNKNISDAGITSPSQVKEFYTLLNFKPAWINKENKINGELLLSILKKAAFIGLNEKDYQFYYVELYRHGAVHLQDADDSIQAEIRFTDAAIHFYNDIAHGNIKPALEYDGLKYTAACKNIPALLADHILKNSLDSLIFNLSPALPEITLMENKIKWIQTVLEADDFKEVIITSNKVNRTNSELITKLFQLGMIDSADSDLSENNLKQKVKEAQRQFSLLADGSLRNSILQELNMPLSTRLQQLNISINYYRWLYCLSQNQPVIVVNIPAAYLKVYYNNEVNLEMKVVVGKKSTPTPSLSSSVNEVILYPYWTIPFNIASKELLPIFKRSPAYINEGNYQVLNKAGKIMDPYLIHWHQYNKNYFPFIIRQGTGCDNSLGLIKLNFYSPFAVYLHDTPIKSSFMLNKRFFSHGCIRMEKPIALGHLILKNNSIAIDSLEQKGCLQNQAPITVPATAQLPVIVWYNPAGIDSTGRILFYEDVYEKFNWMKTKE